MAKIKPIIRYKKLLMTREKPLLLIGEIIIQIIIIKCFHGCIQTPGFRLLNYE